jgi:thioesterase domain-containing protein
MLDAEDVQRLLAEQIPITNAMGVTVASYDGDSLVLTAPLPQNHNHLNTAFGGSLHALATLACYGWLWLELQDPSIHVVVRESHASYRRPVTGELRATCSRPTAEMLERFRIELVDRGKARLRLQATIAQDGAVAVQFDGEFVAIR